MKKLLIIIFSSTLLLAFTLQGFAHANKIADTSNHLVLQLNLDAVNTDNTYIGLDPGAKTQYVVNEDAAYLMGHGKVNLASVSSDNILCAINRMPLPKQAQIINLFLTASADGVYNLTMPEYVLPPAYEVWLKDAYKADSVKMQLNAAYTFDILKADTNSYGRKRFSLVIRGSSAPGVQLLNFTASESPAGAEIIWKMANEQNGTNLMVERSTDGGASFRVLDGFLSSNAGTYSYLDKEPQQLNQYRLKIDDTAGAVSYSAIVTLMYANANKTASRISVYPNPAGSTVNLSIDQSTASATQAPAFGRAPALVNGQSAYAYDIKITSITGLVVKSATSASASWQQDVNGLSPGTYIIQVLNSSNKSVIGKATFVKL